MRSAERRAGFTCPGSGSAGPLTVTNLGLGVGNVGEVTGMPRAPTRPACLLSLRSSLQRPCGVGHPGEQPAGVEGGAAAASTVSAQGAGGLRAEGHAWLGR